MFGVVKEVCDIQHCYVQGIDFTVINTTGEGSVGGLIGGYNFMANDGIIQCCYAIGKIRSDVNSLGGIIGYASDARISNNYTLVNITGEGESAIGGKASAKR